MLCTYIACLPRKHWYIIFKNRINRRTESGPLVNLPMDTHKSWAGAIIPDRGDIQDTSDEEVEEEEESMDEQESDGEQKLRVEDVV